MSRNIIIVVPRIGSVIIKISQNITHHIESAFAVSITAYVFNNHGVGFFWSHDNSRLPLAYAVWPHDVAGWFVVTFGWHFNAPQQYECECL